MQAAAVPLSALTAWQALFDHASLVAGQTVLIHGAAGGVGVFAVQLARLAGAYVSATASARNRDFLRELGASAVIDYSTAHFEQVVHDVDLVLDMVGGDTLERSWQVVKPGGVLVSVASPPSPEEAKAHDVRPVWFIVEPNREQLIQIGALIDTGRIRPIIETVLPFPRHAKPTSKEREGTREVRLSYVWWTKELIPSIHRSEKGMRMQVGPPHVGVARLKWMMFQLLQDLPSGNDSGEAGYQAYSGHFPCTSYLPLLYSARYG